MKNTELLIKLAAPNVEYGPRAEADLARILSTPAPTPPKMQKTHRNHAPLTLAACAVLVALIGMIVFRPVAASATPPLMEATPIAGSAQNHLMKLAELRRKGAWPRTAIELHAWSLVSEIDAAGKVVASNTSPTVSSTTFSPDGSVTIETVVGRPFPGQEVKDLPIPGTPLSSEHLSAEKSVAASASGVLPEDADQLAQWLETAFSVDPANTEESTLSLLRVLVNTTVTPAQEATVLEYLASRPDVTLIGQVTDRLGRSALSFRIGSDVDNYQQNLIIATDTGQIIATETIYTGNDRHDITAPAVTSYEAWERK